MGLWFLKGGKVGYKAPGCHGQAEVTALPPLRDQMQRRLIVVVDTREQTPWEFVDVPTVRRALKFGDYSLRGSEGKCAIERKSAADLAGTLTQGLERFLREFERARKKGASLFLLAECSYLEFEATVAQWSPGRRASSTLARFAARSGSVPLFCGTRKRAAMTALAILREHNQ